MGNKENRESDNGEQINSKKVEKVDKIKLKSKKAKIEIDFKWVVQVFLISFSVTVIFISQKINIH